MDYEDSYEYMVDEARARAAKLKRQLDVYRKLLHDINQCAPLDISALEDDFRFAIQAVREALEAE